MSFKIDDKFLLLKVRKHYNDMQEKKVEIANCYVSS